MANQSEVDRLLQTEWRENIIPNLGGNPWIRVYEWAPMDSKEQVAFYCGLLPSKNVSKSLSNYQWDIHPGDSGPSLIQSCEDKQEESAIQYDRFGHSEYGIEPLVIVRDFRGIRPSSLEISEEFRLFHNLYYEQSKSEYVKFDESGDTIPVIRVLDKHVEIDRKYIRQFLAAKRMSLAIFFEFMFCSKLTLEQLGLTAQNAEFHNETYRYWFLVEDFPEWSDDGYYSRSWIMGKCILDGPPLHKCGIWPFDDLDEERHEEFCIGIDANDQRIVCTPDGISHTLSKEITDSAGKLVRVGYLTQVFFRRKVLNKYYSEPSKYSVEDGRVICHGGWILRMDNNHDEYVIVFLGRLNDDLPVSEQSHWRHDNVPPYGCLSRTAIRRNFHAEWAKPDDNAFGFRDAYRRLSKCWRERMCWYLFKPLSDADTHHFSKLRRPLTGESTELNDIVLSLSILLQDSINVKELRKRIPDFDSKDSDGKDKRNIPILGEYLESEGLRCAVEFVEYLRMLQMLRSNSGTVHRRNETEYQKAATYFSLYNKSTVQVADDIFTTLTEFFDNLREYFCQDDPD